MSGHQSKLKKNSLSPAMASVPEKNLLSLFLLFVLQWYLKDLLPDTKQTATSILPAEIYNLITGYGIGEETCPRSHSRYTPQIRMSMLPDTLSSLLLSNSHCLSTPFMTNKQTTYLAWQERDVCDPSDEYEPFCWLNKSFPFILKLNSHRYSLYLPLPQKSVQVISINLFTKVCKTTFI